MNIKMETIKFQKQYRKLYDLRLGDKPNVLLSMIAKAQSIESTGLHHQKLLLLET